MTNGLDHNIGTDGASLANDARLKQISKANNAFLKIIAFVLANPQRSRWVVDTPALRRDGIGIAEQPPLK